MGLDTRSLRNALGAFATGVTIVTTRRADGGDVGLTANSFSSVSLDPPMILWSLARTSSNIESFRAAGHFAVHILSADQDALSAQFASKTGDKFAGVEFHRGRDDIPLLRACAARFECRTAFQYEGGDHVIFVGEVLEFTHSEKPPLVFHGGRYGMVLRKDAPPDPAPGSESSLSPNDLMYLISRAFHQIREQAVAERRRRGWSESEYAVLSVLGRGDGRTLPEIAAVARFHDWRVTEDAAASLVTQGLVTNADGRLRLTDAGRQAIMELIAILKSDEADALEAFDSSEVQLLKQLLRRLTARSDAQLQAAVSGTRTAI
jgi:3-hydroxy-9,10-secoandrosta-1,3,5(10)-triene-9,17-dione monooxygenase reductase component